jgi:putative aldouronate transport system substrate-binding protein
MVRSPPPGRGQYPRKEDFMKRAVTLAIAVALATILASTPLFAQKAPVKPASIKFMVDGTFQIKENGEQVLVDGFKALDGVTLDLMHPIHNEYSQKVDLAFTTGDIPDVVLMSNNNYLKYLTNGALYDMTALYEKSELKKRIKSPSLVEALKIDGHLYGLPGDRGNGTITYVRGDWLEKLGLKAPTTYDEFINMLRLFKNKNPDGLAPDKVIPYTGPGLVNVGSGTGEYPLDIYLREFYQDATPDFVKVGGKWADGMAQPNMVAALKRMKDAYAEGLIDKEIITNKTSTCRDKFNSGIVGVFNYWAGTWNDTLQKNIKPNAPQAKVTPIPAIKGVKYIERPGTTYCITSNAKNPEGIFQYFFERLWDGGKGQMFATFGVEGTFYKIENGEIKFLPSIQDPKKPFTKAMWSPELPMTDWKPNWKAPFEITNSLEMFQKDMVAYGLLPASDVLTQLQPELNSMRISYVSKIVYGQLGLDEGVAAYKKEAAKYVDAILKDINKGK